MGRQKQIVGAGENASVIGGSPDDLPTPPVGQKITKTTTIKSEDLPGDDPSPPSRADKTDASMFDDGGDSSLPFFDDPLADFFEEAEAEAESTLEVYRHSGTSASPRAGKMKFVSEFAYTDSLLSDIQAACGGGWFTIMMRGVDPDTGRKGILRRRAIEIEGAPKEFATAAATTNPQASSALMASPTPPGVVAPPAAVNSKLDDLTTRLLDKAIERAFEPPVAAAKQPTAEPPPTLAKQLEENVGLLVTMTKLVERITPPREDTTPPAPSSGWLGDVASLAHALGLKDIIAPIGKSIMAQMIASRAGAATAGAPEPGAGADDPQLAAGSSPLAPDVLVESTMKLIVDDLKKNKRTGHAADAIDDLYMKLPELKTQLQPFFALPAPALLAELSQAAREDLLAYSHSIDWIESLQNEFTDADGEADAAQVESVVLPVGEVTISEPATDHASGEAPTE